MICVPGGPSPHLAAGRSALCSCCGSEHGLMGLTWLPWCGTSATDVRLCGTTGGGPVSCAFLQSGSPQLQQGAGTSGPLAGMDTATSSSSGADQAPLAQASAQPQAGARTPVFSLLKQITWGMGATTGSSCGTGWAPLVRELWAGTRSFCHSPRQLLHLLQGVCSP